MQARQHKAQSGKGTRPLGAPLAFQLSSPSKIAKRNVLDAPAPQTLVSSALAGAGTTEDNATASSKVRPKKSRWGPDQPTGSPILPVAASGKPWPPASGFKGVTSHRPPGAPLLTKAAKQPDANAPPLSKEVHQPAADLSNGKDIVRTPLGAAAASQVTRHHSPSSLDVPSGHYSPKADRLHHISAGNLQMASSKGRYSHSPIREPSQALSREHLRPFSRERSQSPSRTGVMPRDQMRPSSRDNGYPREHFKGPGRDSKDSKDRDFAIHDIAQNKRPRYNRHYQDYYERDRGPVNHTDHDQIAANRGGHDWCLAGRTVPYIKQHEFSRRDDRSHRSSHRSDDNGGGRQPQRSRSHSKTPGGGSSGDRRKQERQARHRSPSHEEEGQITDRPTTRSPVLGRDAPKLPGQQLNRSPGQLQSQKPLVSLSAHQPHQPGSHQKAVQEPASAPAAAAAALPATSPSEPADVQAQQLALQQVLQLNQEVDQTADLTADPMSQPARPLQLDPAAVSLVKPLTPAASTLSTVVATNNDFASLDPEATTLQAELHSNRTASAAQLDPCAAEHAAAGGVAGVPIPDTAKASVAFKIVNDEGNQSDPDRAIPSSLRGRPVQHSPREGRCTSLHRPAQQSPRTRPGRSRQPVEHHTEPCRVRRQFEDAPPLSAHAINQKRSQTPDTQTESDAKRSRHDQWQPGVSSSQARVHRSRQISPPSFRENQITMEVRREAAKPATLRPGEARESSHYVSTRSRQHALLPKDAYTNRRSSESREPSMSTSPSPVHRRALQPHGPHPNRGKGGPAAPHLDDWQSDRWHNGDRNIVRDSGRLPSDLSQHGSFAQTLQLSSGDCELSQHDASHGGHRHGGGGTYHGHHSHDRDVPLRSNRNDRGRSFHDMDNGYPPHMAHVARDLPCTDRHAFRASPPLTESDRHGQHRLSKSEQEGAARFSAQKLDWDTDQMMVKLLGAYGKPAEAIGDRQVLEAMREAVRVIGNMDEDNKEASPGFLVTRQDLPEWLPETKKQQVVNMLFPAAWLHQDPDFQPQWKLPLGWEPPECAGDGLRPPAEPLDCTLQEGLQQVSDLKTNTVTMLLSREEAEAGDPGLDDSWDPRTRACSTRPAQPLLLPMPLFPFLPHLEGSTYDSPSTSPDVSEGGSGGVTAGPIDQLAPGGFLYDFWDMCHRAASPAGSWSTTPHTLASAGWEEAWRPVSASEWGTSGHLEPPAAPSHTTNTEQQYTDQMTTTAQPQWPPHEASTGQQHGDMFEVQQQPHWQQQQQDEAITPAPPSRVPPPQAPSTPQLQRPAYYPDPEPADYHIQFCDQMGLKTWSLATLRQDMRCGKGDALPSTPILNKADGYWLPLREGRWLPDHLHWAGIDQMVTQGAAITSDAVTSAEAMSDGGLEEWVIHTLASCHHQALPTLQLPHDMATAQHQQISTFATTAGIGAAAEASDQDSALTTAAASPSIEDDAALGEVLASQQWFDSFHLPSAYEERTSNTGTSQSGDDGHGIGHGRCCWGPQPPPQYTAMLCGELSLAVMSGVAGKSLIKEVLDRVIQQELDKTKANQPNMFS